MKKTSALLRIFAVRSGSNMRFWYLWRLGKRSLTDFPADRSDVTTVTVTSGWFARTRRSSPPVYPLPPHIATRTTLLPFRELESLPCALLTVFLSLFFPGVSCEKAFFFKPYAEVIFHAHKSPCYPVPYCTCLARETTS